MSFYVDARNLPDMQMEIVQSNYFWDTATQLFIVQMSAHAWTECWLFLIPMIIRAYTPQDITWGEKGRKNFSDLWMKTVMAMFEAFTVTWRLYSIHVLETPLNDRFLGGRHNAESIWRNWPTVFRSLRDRFHDVELLSRRPSEQLTQQKRPKTTITSYKRLRLPATGYQRSNFGQISRNETLLNECFASF